VEPTFASIGRHRRTVRNCEHLPASHEAMIALMTRRLARTQGVGKVVPAVTGKVAARSGPHRGRAPDHGQPVQPCDHHRAAGRSRQHRRRAALPGRGSVAHCKRSRSAERLAGPGYHAPAVLPPVTGG